MLVSDGDGDDGMETDVQCDANTASRVYGEDEPLKQ